MFVVTHKSRAPRRVIQEVCRRVVSDGTLRFAPDERLPKVSKESYPWMEG